MRLYLYTVYYVADYGDSYEGPFPSFVRVLAKDSIDARKTAYPKAVAEEKKTAKFDPDSENSGDAITIVATVRGRHRLDK